MQQLRRHCPAFAALLCFLLLSTPRAGRTAVPRAVYVLPKQVTLLPDRDAAQRVVVRGAFILAPRGAPQPAVCGKMYFACPSGSEERCRAQWGAIAAASLGKVCQGFGALGASDAALLGERDALGDPRAWDPTTPIEADDYVEKQCPLATFLDCPTVGGDVTDDTLPSGGCAVAQAQGGGWGLGLLLLFGLRRRGRRGAVSP